jgi:hypothetical protein
MVLLEEGAHFLDGIVELLVSRQDANFVQL